MTRDHAYKLREMIVKASASLDDTDALEAVELFPVWGSDRAYVAGERVRYGGLLYRCVQAHSSQSDWTPDAVPALWVRVDDPAEEWPAWRQPLSAEDAYPAGARVSHSGKHWISTADNNVWVPGVYGWTEV